MKRQPAADEVCYFLTMIPHKKVQKIKRDISVNKSPQTSGGSLRNVWIRLQLKIGPHL